MNSIIIGCDPGVGGYLAAIDENRRYLGSWEMPLLPKRADRKSNRVDPLALAAIIRQIRKENQMRAIYGAIEDLQSMGGGDRMQAFAMASMGLAAGVAVGVMAVMCNSHMMIPPQEWKRAYRCSKDKSVSVIQARSIYRDQLPKQFGSGRAEALLIADHALSKGIHF